MLTRLALGPANPVASCYWPQPAVAAKQYWADIAQKEKKRERGVEREGATAAGVIFADLSLLSNEI